MKTLWIKTMITLNGQLRRLKEEEQGMGMVEIALIIVIIITLGITFKEQINEFLLSIFDSFDLTQLSTR